MRNRFHNAKNKSQGFHKKVLCVCSAGLLRSPTLAYVLANRGYNTRACGAVRDMALIPVEEILLYWADEVVFVDEAAKKYTEYEVSSETFNRYKDKYITLNIPDMYEFRDPDLVFECEEQYERAISNGNK